MVVEPRYRLGNCPGMDGFARADRLLPTGNPSLVDEI
jgi:hypothetical protein